MKKVVVMSDNHGNDSMMEYIKAQEPHADYYIIVEIVKHPIKNC